MLHDTKISVTAYMLLISFFENTILFFLRMAALSYNDQNQEGSIRLAVN